MSNQNQSAKAELDRLYNRRQMLKLGLASMVGVAGVSLVLSNFRQKSKVKVPPLSKTEDTSANSYSPLVMLREFDYGTVKQENGRTVREFNFEAKNSILQLTKAVSFPSWNINGRVPGPTIRATEGDLIRVIFHNSAGHSHSLHFHGIHPADMDGVVPILHGGTKVFEFDAEPFGVHLYHCHIPPIARHIGKGLYGMFIIEPKQGRPSADEMVLVMGGYDVNQDGRNELYAFNGIPDYYKEHPILIQQDQLIRLYLLNITELEAPLSFHLHANMFQVYRTGRTLTPSEETDVITMGIAERHILEFSYRTPGMYMFHPHQDQIAEAGCMGLFNVVGNT